MVSGNGERLHNFETQDLITTAPPEEVAAEEVVYALYKSIISRSVIEYHY
jgi:hypothetical protein